MNSKELVQAILAGERTGRVVFCPAIYEHKARLINKSVSEVAMDSKLLSEAVIAEYEIYRPDMLTVGIDIYNIEVEAIGCNIRYSQSSDVVPEVQYRLLDNISQVGNLKPVDIEHSARAPQILSATENVHRKLGSEVFVRGCVSGPFSMAAAMMGIESLLMACVMKPEQAKVLIDFCTEISITHAKAYVKRGLCVCVFDSYVAPPLLSPKMYKSLVLPGTRRIAKELKQMACEFIEYVVGGKTDDIATNMAFRVST